MRYFGFAAHRIATRHRSITSDVAEASFESVVISLMSGSVCRSIKTMALTHKLRPSKPKPTKASKLAQNDRFSSPRPTLSWIDGCAFSLHRLRRAVFWCLWSCLIAFDSPAVDVDFLSGCFGIWILFWGLWWLAALPLTRKRWGETNVSPVFATKPPALAGCSISRIRSRALERCRTYSSWL